MPKFTVKIIPSTSEINYSKNYRIFTVVDVIENVTDIWNIEDNIEIGSADIDYLKRYFRYSKTGENWSLWYEFKPGNPAADGLEVITALPFDHDEFLYVSFKYEYDDGSYDQLENPIVVNEIKIKLNLYADKVPLDLDLLTARVKCTEESCPLITFDRNTSFNPYDVGGFTQLYKELSFMTNNLFGHTVLYFRTMPEEGGGDYIFREWNLYNIADKKCIKILVPNNDFPDNKLFFNEFGIDFEVPFEVHIDKGYFESMFNKDSEPRKKDFLYFPLINRMFEIQGSYLYRGFMMEPTFWRAQLIKYTPNINYLLNAENTQFLDNLLLHCEETLSQVVNKDVEDALNKKQYKTISSRYDETRESLNTNLAIRQMSYYFNYAVLIDYYYNLAGLTQDEVAVQYKANGVLNDELNNLTFTCLFNVMTGGLPVNFLCAYDTNSPSDGAGIDIFGSHTISSKKLSLTVRLNDKDYTFSLDDVDINTWYGLIVQVSKEFKQIGVFTYDIEKDPNDIQNHNDFILGNKRISTITDVSFTTDESYLLKASTLSIANIRIFKKLLKQEDHQFVLSQLFVKDESMLYLIDNSRPQLNAPYVMRKK